MVKLILQSKGLAQKPIKFLVTKLNPGKKIEKSTKITQNVSKLPRHVHFLNYGHLIQKGIAWKVVLQSPNKLLMSYLIF